MYGIVRCNSFGLQTFKIDSAAHGGRIRTRMKENKCIYSDNNWKATPSVLLGTLVRWLRRNTNALATDHMTTAQESLSTAWGIEHRFFLESTTGVLKSWASHRTWTCLAPRLLGRNQSHVSFACDPSSHRFIECFWSGGIGSRSGNLWFRITSNSNQILTTRSISSTKCWSGCVWECISSNNRFFFFFKNNKYPPEFICARSCREKIGTNTADPNSQEIQFGMCIYKFVQSES